MYQILGNDTHWMLPHSLVIVELICALDIVIHSAIVLWISDVYARERYYDYYGHRWPDTERQITGTTLPFLM